MKNLLSSATRLVLLMVMVTLCYLAIRQLPVDPAFKDIVLMIVSFYFGGKTTSPDKTGDNSLSG